MASITSLAGTVIHKPTHPPCCFILVSIHWPLHLAVLWPSDAGRAKVLPFPSPCIQNPLIWRNSHRAQERLTTKTSLEVDADLQLYILIGGWGGGSQKICQVSCLWMRQETIKKIKALIRIRHLLARMRYSSAESCTTSFYSYFFHLTATCLVHCLYRWSNDPTMNVK